MAVKHFIVIFLVR